MYRQYKFLDAVHDDADHHLFFLAQFENLGELVKNTIFVA